MPMYEFECSACGQATEKLLKMSDPTPKDCSLCEATGTLRKLISKGGFALQGDGWYSDHYGIKKNSGSKPKSSDTSSASKPATKPASD